MIRFLTSGGSAPPAIDPPATNLLGWWKGDSAGTGSVPQWNGLDGSGNPVACVQAKTAARPAVSGTLINNAKALTFDPTDDGYFTALDLGTTLTIGVIYKPNQANALNRMLQSTTINAFIGPYQAKHKVHWNGAWVGVADGSQPAVVSGTQALVILTASGGQAQYYFNGVQQGGNTAVSGSWGGLALGISGAFAEPAGSDVAEIVVYSDQKTGAGLTTLTTYLMGRAGL